MSKQHVLIVTFVRPNIKEGLKDRAAASNFFFQCCHIRPHEIDIIDVVSPHELLQSVLKNRSKIDILYNMCEEVRVDLDIWRILITLGLKDEIEFFSLTRHYNEDIDTPATIPDDVETQLIVPQVVHQYRN
ncbi:MAG TPA: hypothetical protein VEC17_03695 [Candidatus Binatia bacterium]|nr:hypothetical protein [Candidatus Binatia bacterium]